MDLNKGTSNEVKYDLRVFLGSTVSWYTRLNLEDRINRKPDDQKMTIQPKNQKNIRPNSTVLNLIFCPIYI